jgi:hypothetical protein
MKHINIKRLLFVAAITMTMGLISSCEDFLNRPDKGSYTLPDFYQNDEQLAQAVNPLYSVPWFDFIRGWIRVGDSQAGNYFMDADGFWMLTPKNGTVDEQLADMSASLWAVNARANTVLENIDLYAGPGTTEVGRKTAKGETLVWKAMSYFYMARIFGAVPIVHNNTELLGTGEYGSLYRAQTDNVYDYIILTLNQAVEWLPEQNKPGRIDKYSAYALLSKVYLTKSGYGRNGDRNQEDLDQAKEYARKVIKESGRSLEPEYSDIFRGSHNLTEESLLSWRWVSAGETYWTASNGLHRDLGMKNFSEEDAWGDWTGPSLDLQKEFGEDALRLTRNNTDKRRKATMMMFGDVYSYFWRDHPTKVGPSGQDVKFPDGFDFSKFCGEVLGTYNSSTGANVVKHLYGNYADHQAEMSEEPGFSGNSLATHLLRLADVYLIYAESVLGNGAATSDAEALAAFNAVRSRAGVATKSAITFEDIWKERRLELAFEGDFWYDFVRLSYYKPDDALNRLKAQERRNYVGLSDYYKNGIDGDIKPEDENDPNGKKVPRINEDQPYAKPTSASVFTIPFPETDLQMNPNLAKDPIVYDLSQYKY